MDFLSSLRRRKWSFLVLVSIGLAITLALVTSWPSFYRSTATIALEEYIEPADVADARTAEYAAARLRQVDAIINTKEHLLTLLSAAGLYSDKLSSLGDDGLAEFVRRGTSTALVGVTIGPTDGRGLNKANVEYAVAYRATDAALAKQVADRLSAEHLVVNRQLIAKASEARDARIKEQLATLVHEKQALGAQLDDINLRLGNLLRAGAGATVTHAADARQQLDAARRNLEVAITGSADLEAEQARLERALAGHEPVIVEKREEKVTVNLSVKKKELFAELAAMTERLGSGHAEVKKIQRSLDDINQRLRQRDAAQAQRADLLELRKVLDHMRKTKPANDPDLVMMSELEQRFVQEIGRQSPDVVETRTVDTRRPNPEYQLLESGLRAVRERLRMALETANSLRASITTLEAAAAELATAGSAQDDLVQQQKELQERHDAVAARLENFSAAGTAGGTDPVGTVVLAKPAQLAAYSEKSGSYRVLIAGVFASLALGVLYVWVSNRGDTAVRSAAMLMRATGKGRRTVVIPYIYTDAELRHGRMRSALNGTLLVGGWLLLIAAVSYTREPLSEWVARLF